MSTVTEPRPTKEFVERWIRTLESGQYRKGVKRLRSNYDSESFSFCCLGVAAKLNGDLTDVPNDPFDPRGKTFPLKDGDDVALPHQLYGLDEDFMAELMTLNDENDGFKKVIARIKAEFPDVFDPTTP